MPYALAFLIGVVAGLRSLTAPAVVSWGARLGWLHLENTWLAFLGAPVTPYILSLLAIGELISDKLPKTPTRKAPLGFGALLAGVIGAVAGTLGGYEVRRRLVRAIGGKDFPIALIEDVIAVGGAVL